MLSIKIQQKHEKNTKMIKDFVNQIVLLGMNLVEYKELNNGKDIPISLLRQWKLLLLENKPLNENVEISFENDKIKSIEIEGASIEETDIKKEITNLLDDSDLEAYLNSDEKWGENNEM